MQQGAVFHDAKSKKISIHAPYKGCNLSPSMTIDPIGIISIHAPYKGCNGDLYLNLSISNENRLKLLLFLRK